MRIQLILRSPIVAAFAPVMKPSAVALPRRSRLPWQSPRPRIRPQRRSDSSFRGVRAARAFERVQEGPSRLQAFLTQFPKGADLHVHLSGAVYAETLHARGRRTTALRRHGGADVHASRRLQRDQCCRRASAARGSSLTPAPSLTRTSTTPGRRLFHAQLRPHAGWSGHDQFFATFDRFRGLGNTHAGEWVDEVATAPPAQNQQYLELMETPPFGKAAEHRQRRTPAGECMDFAAAPPAAALAQGLSDEVAADRSNSRRRGRRANASSTADAACSALLRGANPLPLPGAARLPAAAGLRADAARL